MSTTKQQLKITPIGEVRWKQGDSHFWSGLMKAINHFLESSTFNIHNGEQIRFWEDNWLGNFTLKEQYSSLLSKCIFHPSSIAKVWYSSFMFHLVQINPLTN
jgi:hypothetical protein